MSKMTTEELDELKAEIKEALSEKRFIAKYIGVAIFVVTTMAAVFASWYSSKDALAQNTKDIAEQKNIISKHSTEIESIKIDSVGKAGDLNIVKSKLEEVNKKIDNMDVKLDKVLLRR